VGRPPADITAPLTLTRAGYRPWSCTAPSSRTTPHNTAQHRTTPHNTAQHRTTPHNTAHRASIITRQHHCFYERWINHLIWSLTDLELINDQQAEQLLPPLLEQLSPFHVVTGSDRSVQAHITDVVQVGQITRLPAQESGTSCRF
jgi:hypothetical protein